MHEGSMTLDMAGRTKTDVDKAGRRHSRGSHLRVVVGGTDIGKTDRGYRETAIDACEASVDRIHGTGVTSGMAGEGRSGAVIGSVTPPSAEDVSRALRTLADALDAIGTGRGERAAMPGLLSTLGEASRRLRMEGEADARYALSDASPDVAHGGYADGWLSVMGGDVTKPVNAPERSVDDAVPDDDAGTVPMAAAAGTCGNVGSAVRESGNGIARALELSWETRAKQTADASARGTRYANRVVWEADGIRMTAYGPKSAGIVRAAISTGSTEARQVSSGTASVIAPDRASLVPAPGMSPLMGPVEDGETITVYTDGSASPLIIGERTWLSRVGTRRSGMGVRFLERGIERTYLGGIVMDGPIVSNEIEMLTVMSAIRAAVSAGYRSIDVLYDCSAIASTWEGRSDASKDPITRQLSVMRGALEGLGVSVRLIHVKGHAGELNNEQCDAVAKSAAWSAMRSFQEMAMTPGIRLDGIPGIGPAIKARAAGKDNPGDGGKAGKIGKAAPRVNGNGITILDGDKGIGNGAPKVEAAPSAATAPTRSQVQESATHPTPDFVDPETLPPASMCRVSDDSATERRRTTKALLVAACRDLGLSSVGQGVIRTVQYDKYRRMDGIGKATGRLLDDFIKGKAPSNRDTNLWKDVATFLADGCILDGADAKRWREVSLVLAVAVANGCSTDKALRVACVRKTGKLFDFPSKPLPVKR